MPGKREHVGHNGGTPITASRALRSRPLGDRWGFTIPAVCCLLVFAALLTGMLASSTSGAGLLGVFTLFAAGAGGGLVVAHWVVDRGQR
jgi:predicted anti-sigma-YlaC factor YlaD